MSQYAPAASSQVLRALFERVADGVAAQAQPGELLAATLDAESSEFIRFNHARIRQAGRVERAVLRLRLVADTRQATLALTLPGTDAGVDALRAAMRPAMARMRSAIADSEPDPLLDVSREARVAVDDLSSPPFDREAFVDTVVAAAGDADLVGFAAAGPFGRGFCSSVGSRLWHARDGVSFDFSIHLAPDASAGGARKALKAGWTGDASDLAGLHRAVAAARHEAMLLARPVMRLEPGDHRVLLAPRALADLLEMLAWGGFSARSHRTGGSPLARLQRGEASLSPMLTLAEDMEAGFAPPFQSDGYARPRRTVLVEGGRFADWLVSPRTAREFGLASNAASEAEVPESLRVSPGTLPAADGLARLGTGLALGNLWYLNFSDRPACRVTGMSRFASFWVEGGEVVAPVEAMRFDDSLYRALGEHLEALTVESARLPNTDTYEGRGHGGIEAPGALLSSLRFTL